MIKKLFFLLGCVFPMVAMSATPPTSLTNISGYNGVYCTQQSNGMWFCDPGPLGLGVGSDGWLDQIDTTVNSVVIESGNSLTVQGGTLSGIANPGYGLFLPGNIEVEEIGGITSPGASSGVLYIENTAGANFTISSVGNIKVAGSVNVGTGRTLNISGLATTNADFGSISNKGILNIGDSSNKIAKLKSGSITTQGNMSLFANQMELGAVTNSSGNTAINSTGALQMSHFVSNSANTSTIIAGSISSGDIQNNVGTMNITSAGALTSTGRIDNSGTEMTIDAAGAVTALTMKNDSNSSTMIVNATGLTLTGGSLSAASFVNAGDLFITVSGATNLGYGFDLSNMQTTNKFSLETGTLIITNNNADAWLRLFSNRLNSFKVTITNGDIDQQSGNIDIANGINQGGNNAVANMDLKAQSIKVTSVLNAGNKLNMNATNAAGGIYVSSSLTGNTGSNTTLDSAGALNVTGGVSNKGTMILKGNSINLSSVNNINGKMDILSLTDQTGAIKITGGVENDAAGSSLTINARDIEIVGALINKSGTTTIRGSDSNGTSVKIGSINASGGVINLNSLLGSFDISGRIDVAAAGSMNFGNPTIGQSTKKVTVGNSVDIAGNLTASGIAATGAGNMNIDTPGPGFVMKSTNGNITIHGDALAVANDVARTVTLDSRIITVDGNVTAGGQGRLTFGDTLATNLTVGGNLVSNNGGIIDLKVGDVAVNSLSGAGTIIARGNTINAIGNANNTINIQNGIWFDGTDPAQGFIVKDTNNLTLYASGTGADISVAGGIFVGNVRDSSNNIVPVSLTLKSADQINVSGAVSIKTQGTLKIDAATSATFANTINNVGTLNIKGVSVTATNGITSSGATDLIASGALISGSIVNTGAFTANANTITATAVSQTAGSMEFTTNSLDMTLMSITGGYANLNTDSIAATGGIAVGVNGGATGNLVQGATSGVNGMLNLTVNNTTLAADNLTVNGNFIANRYNAAYNINKNFNVTGSMTVANGANVALYAGNAINIDGVTNDGILSLVGDSLDLGAVINSGTIALNSGTSKITVDSFKTNSNSSTTLRGTDMISSGNIDLAGKLLQNATGTIGRGDANVVANRYDITATSVKTTGINQTSGKMTLNTDDLDVSGSIMATDLRVAAQISNWLTVDVGGNIYGGVDFIGLEKMYIGGNYIFDDNSIIMAAILDRGVTQHNYWATINSQTGQITNGANAEPLISINGKFISNMSSNNANMHNQWNTGVFGEIKDGQIGVVITDIVDQGSAIWLVHANNGVEEKGNKLRDAVVRFCNANGTICYNYLNSVGSGSTNNNDLPIYLSLRDFDGDGEADSWYLVFDPRFSGPVEVFKIQPIVGRENVYTKGEYLTAGALDNLIASRLYQTGFYNRTPITVMPLIFQNTNLETAAQELYNRMEQYILNYNGAGLARFSRLFQPREIEQVAGNIALNEHTTFRDFEDHMFDEFIWNRNRSLKKAWLNVDIGMFDHMLSDDKRTGGDRFGVHGGFDWQGSETLIMGLTAHASRMSSSNWDEIDLGYKPNRPVAGRVDVDVMTTNLGAGAYLMNTLGAGVRVYGNAFVDLQLFDISRSQNFVSQIHGTGTALSVISEWGLMHDLLNQYIVGNLYARAGYNFGFDITEKAAGSDYMKLESDGYFVLTPGYSLTAQKRIYTSPWFQVRPYLSIGAEYDILGMPDVTKFRFASADKFTDYAVNIGSFWANGGGGIELLSSNGLQFGVDYRYQYNSDIQMHKIKLAGSYRF